MSDNLARVKCAVCGWGSPHYSGDCVGFLQRQLAVLEIKLAEAQRERDIANERWAKQNALLEPVCIERDILRTRCEALEQLKAFTTHLPHCETRFTNRRPCNCGLREVLAGQGESK